MDVDPFFEEKFKFIGKFPFKYRPWLASLSATLAGVVLITAYFQTNVKPEVYAGAETIFAKWEQSPQDEALFQEMKRSLHQLPDLEKKYEPRIVQKLLEVGKSKEAIEFAGFSLKEIDKEAPFHGAFAKITLLIEQGSYQKALELSVSLKEKMMNEWDLEKFFQDKPVGGGLLYVHNLLRLACLQKELKNSAGEMAAWEELETFLQNHRDSFIVQTFQSNFREKDLNLSDYITERKKQL